MHNTIDITKYFTIDLTNNFVLEKILNDNIIINIKEKIFEDNLQDYNSRIYIYKFTIDDINYILEMNEINHTTDCIIHDCDKFIKTIKNSSYKELREKLLKSEYVSKLMLLE